jgi:signal transduction histidine kinase
VEGSLYLPAVPASAYASIASAIRPAMGTSAPSEGNVRTTINGVPHLLFYKRINPESAFRPGYEICLYPLTEYEARQQRLLWQIGGAGVLLLLVGLIASHFLARRLAAPVEKLAVDSAQNRLGRQRAEAALESTSEELERTARYSADASHQLKSPVTVLRAGLESLLGRDDFKPEVYDELSALVHQTYRLTGVIDDLLLLSRMDAGQLRIRLSPINLTELVEEWLEDLGAMPDALDLQTEKEMPPDLLIAGERRYTSLIVQNLLENARKYNRPGGVIRIRARSEGDGVALSIGNTGHSISPEAQANLFMRFQRGAVGETVAGHGLGLNLARELARLHGGELRLVESRDDWTEFEVRFRAVHSVGEVPEIPKT